MRTLPLLLLLPAIVAAQSAPRLGTVSFPTSVSRPAAQQEFEQGVLWMHSFEYEHAAESFRRAQQEAPDFVMAYWGEAMTHNHPIWNERDADAARAVLARLAPSPEARAAKARTARERAWLQAAEVLWGEGPKPLRDTLYLQAMEQVARDHPDDEAAAFLSLAHMGLSQGVRDIPSYMRAGKIALELFTRSPDHPGAAHYVIHAFDDPDHAILALDAARAYSRIAPDAGHAQHMTTHIFLALGMWDEVSRQNVVAMQAARGNSDSLEWTSGHYTWWLHYSRAQQGKWADARRWLARQDELLPADATPARRNNLQQRHNELRLNTGDFTSAFSPNTASATDATTLLVRGIAAWRGQDRDALARETAALRALRSSDPDDVTLRLLTPQLEALLHGANGHEDSALAVLREAVALEASLPMDFGPPAILRPAHEALAEGLLVAGRFAEAQAAYHRALARTPGRSRSLAGLAQAASKAGDSADAERAMKQLRANFHAADPGALEALLKSVP